MIDFTIRNYFAHQRYFQDSEKKFLQMRTSIIHTTDYQYQELVSRIKNTKSITKKQKNRLKNKLQDEKTYLTNNIWRNVKPC